MRRVSTLASGKSLLLVSSRSFSFSLNYQFAFPLSLSSCLVYMSWPSSQLNTKKGLFKAVQRSLWDSYLPANTTLLAALALIKAHLTTHAGFWACLCLSFLCNNQKTFHRKDVKSIGFMSFFSFFFLNLSSDYSPLLSDTQLETINAYSMSIKKSFFSLKGILTV